ncbi:Bifunctional protein hldE [Anaerobiospirillum thomasii]|uniref:Bifunctional protein hldE n=1 Tax=Anaerobiospirillum thomasii TaxID=179995 RepID=A0A2X0W0B0_9GAMM|nr:Bifunctional protein hldE [Anaerobiospirillum thomasii]
MGKVKDNEDLEKKALDLISRYNLKALLVTRSEDGMSLIVPGRKAEHLPTNAREVYDVTGAGDTVIGTIGACLASGSSLSEACAIANTAAGIVVGKLGTSTVSVDEIKHELGLKQKQQQEHTWQRKLLSRVAKLKAQGLKIVMTNGCFDILHKGHLDYLKRARALGDILIVAVNTDSSVQMLKGPSRPINALEDRMIMLDALECTSLITYFDEETPESLIAAVLPDILVKAAIIL